MVNLIHKPALVISLLIALYLKFLLLPSAMLMFELYHLLNVDLVYHLYSGFKVTSYLFNHWAYQDITCLLVAAVVFSLLQVRAMKKQKKGEI